MQYGTRSRRYLLCATACFKSRVQQRPHYACAPFLCARSLSEPLQRPLTSKLSSSWAQLGHSPVSWLRHGHAHRSRRSAASAGRFPVALYRLGAAHSGRRGKPAGRPSGAAARVPKCEGDWVARANILGSTTAGLLAQCGSSRRLPTHVSVPSAFHSLQRPFAAWSSNGESWSNGQHKCKKVSELNRAPSCLPWLPRDTAPALHLAGATACSSVPLASCRAGQREQ